MGANKYNEYMLERTLIYSVFNSEDNKSSEFLSKNDIKGFLNWEAQFVKDKATQISNAENIEVLDEYCLNNNIEPQADLSSNKGLFLITVFGNLLSSIFLCVVLLIPIDIFNKEYHGGTVKLLMSQPFKRSKIILSKYFAASAFELLMIIVILLPIFIFNFAVSGFSDVSYPVEIMNNYLSFSFLGHYENLLLVPLWFRTLLATILIILAILAFNAIALLLSVFIKNRGLSIAVISILALSPILIFRLSILPVSILNPFSLSYISNDLEGLYYETGENAVTFLDSVASFSLYSILCVGISVFVAKRKQIY